MTPEEIRAAIARDQALLGLVPDSEAIAAAMSEGRMRPTDTEIGVWLALDFALNMTVFTVLFVDPPREKLVTARLRRLSANKGWRGKMARWLAVELLDPFDPSGRHV